MAGRASSRGRREFAHARGVFLQRFLLFAAFAAVLLGFLAFLTLTPPQWIAAVGVLLAVYLVIWGFSPLLTSHTLSRALLILRQGWYFRAYIPLAGIESAEAYEGDAPIGLRASILRGRLYVTGSKVGLVIIRLKEPRRFWSVLGASADEIVFDVDSRGTFLEAFKERGVSLAPVQAERPDAHLRD